MNNLSNLKYKIKPCKSNNLTQLQKAMGLIEELCLEHDDMCDEEKQGGLFVRFIVCPTPSMVVGIIRNVLWLDRDSRCWRICLE